MGCGVGTVLLALRWVHHHRAPLSLNDAKVHFIGSDVDRKSVALMQKNSEANMGEGMKLKDVARRAELCFVTACCKALPFGKSSVDLLLVDPPWGQRHSTYAHVRRGFPCWVREWVRVLRP